MSVLYIMNCFSYHILPVHVRDVAKIIFQQAKLCWSQVENLGHIKEKELTRHGLSAGKIKKSQVLKSQNFKRKYIHVWS